MSFSRRGFLVATASVMAIPACATVPSLTPTQTANSLRRLLSVCATAALELASDDTGYRNQPPVEIGLPSFLAPAQRQLIGRGMSETFNSFTKQLNIAAQKAAGTEDAQVLFFEALNAISLTDPSAVLCGGSTAATRAFRSEMGARIVGLYEPIMKQQLKEAGAIDSELGLLAKLSEGPFAVALPEEVVDLVIEYATEAAVEGLFVFMGEVEKAIRKTGGTQTAIELEPPFVGKSIEVGELPQIHTLFSNDLKCS